MRSYLEFIARSCDKTELNKVEIDNEDQPFGLPFNAKVCLIRYWSIGRRPREFQNVVGFRLIGSSTPNFIFTHFQKMPDERICTKFDTSCVSTVQSIGNLLRIAYLQEVKIRPC